MLRICKKHGETEFVQRKDGYFRCRKCSSASVSKRRKNLKKSLVESYGGKCTICGYDKNIAALTFHHTDPSIKDFGLSDKGLIRSLSRLKLEAAKCILVCHNCHMEIHYDPS